MLNRRILRAKAMQGLYAYYKSQEANFNLALEYINEKYTPDLNSMEPFDRSDLNKRKQSALKVFHQNFRHDSFEKLNETSTEEEETAWEAFRNYNFQNQKDFDYFRSQILKEVEKIYDRYLWLLQLIIELGHVELNDARKHNEKKGLFNNQVIERLKNDSLFGKRITDKRLSWDKERDLLLTWYKTIIKPGTEYNDYLNNAKSGFEQDKKICIHVYKDLLFKNEQFNTYLEAEDINWTEDRHILKSMIQKTLKNLTEDKQTVELATLSNNWEEDVVFFKKLFENTVKNDKDYENLIAEKSKNWDVERMAIIDKIILKMAIGEMIDFPSIPIKVSINEYIELSKNFSTPKSKKFVNGILDVLSEELKVQGIIKKSGRGLIDNK